LLNSGQIETIGLGHQNINNNSETAGECVMGFFNFRKDKGEKVIESPASAADNIKARIEADNPGISDLAVAFADGVVTLSGQAETAAAKEKAMLIAGNVEGVQEVTADALIAPPAEVEVEYYEIQSGDTLSKLAKQYYGDPMRYPEIFEANREVIIDADKIYPGQKIRIPA
jgi:nucleoid-associated protein YgaU